MYPAELIKPMREQLTANGFNELFSEKDVDDFMKEFDKNENRISSK